MESLTGSPDSPPGAKPSVVDLPAVSGLRLRNWNGNTYRSGGEVECPINILAYSDKVPAPKHSWSNRRAFVRYQCGPATPGRVLVADVQEWQRCLDSRTYRLGESACC